MPDAPLVTVVIPVWRDADALSQTLGSLPPQPGAEVVVAAVLGEESSCSVVDGTRPDVRFVSAPRGRGVQMNTGAAAARGRWLLFLHADSRLPPDWLEVVVRADSSPDVTAGAFAVSLDSRDRRARVVEFGVRLRVALLGLPYGDQALFVRTAVFAALGGFRDLPLMEDVDLVRRLKPAGRLLRARARVLTSARRWERDGWVRRSAGNAALAAQFLLGFPPARLAQQYYGRHARAVVLMARAPWTGGKARLRGTLDPETHAGLRNAFFRDTLDVVTSIRRAQHVVACEPAAACERMRGMVDSSVDVFAQRGEDLGDRLIHVFEDAFRLGAESVVVIGSDLPDLPAHLLHQAFERLDQNRRAVVLGPARDGGYYLVGMTRPRPVLFRGIDWGTDRVLDQTLQIAGNHAVPVVLLDPWGDIDSSDDLAAFECGTGTGAYRTRAWLRDHRH